MNLLDKLRGTDDADLVDTRTMFGRTKVYDVMDDDDRILRVLDVNGTWQSATYVDRDTNDLAFGYHQVFDQAFDAPVDITRVLMLGGGALAWPKHVVATRPGVRIDVIEIDQQIVDLAEEWFLLDHLSAPQRSRLRVTCDDAVSFLKKAIEDGRSYDLVANDLFAAKEPAAALMDSEGLDLVKRVLTSDGIYIANVVSALKGRNSRPLRTVEDALEHVFTQVETIPLGEDAPRSTDNNVVFATSGSFSLAGTLDIDYP